MPIIGWAFLPATVIAVYKFPGHMVLGMIGKLTGAFFISRDIFLYRLHIPVDTMQSAAGISRERRDIQQKLPYYTDISSGFS